MQLDPEWTYAAQRGRIAAFALGHRHPWRGLSRRRFISSVLATGAVLATPGFGATIAEASDHNDETLPNPIKGGSVIGQFPLKHFYFPTIPNPPGITSNVVSNGTADPSTIRDFQGIVGSADLPPTGIVTGDPLGGSFWAADCRFMQGRFIDRDHHVHHGTLVFI